jgi:hypothetical protein
LLNLFARAVRQGLKGWPFWHGGPFGRSAPLNVCDRAWLQWEPLALVGKRHPAEGNLILLTLVSNRGRNTGFVVGAEQCDIAMLCAR